MRTSQISKLLIALPTLSVLFKGEVDAADAKAMSHATS